MIPTGASATDFTRESELLPRDLPSMLWRALGVFLALAFTGAVVIAVFVRFPDVVKSPFVLVPRDGADPVKAPMPGTIERVAVSDGAEVKKGDLLFLIRSEDLAVLAERQRRIEAEIAAMGPLEAKLAEAARTTIRAAEVRGESLSAELTFARRRKTVNARLLQIAEGSHTQGLISETQLLAARQADADAGQALERLRRESEDARAAVAQLEATGEQEAAQRAIQLARLRGELAEVRASMDGQADARGDKGDNYAVSAPYDGTVIDMGPRRDGVVVERGEVLCRVAREDAHLLAELSVAELDAGRMAAGQSVKVLLDAFPYTRYGTRSATVTWVSPTASQGAVRARATLIDDFVVIEGRKRPLRAGMVGRAHVVVGSRTLAEYALEPLRQLSENVRAAPSRP